MGLLGNTEVWSVPVWSVPVLSWPASWAQAATGYATRPNIANDSPANADMMNLRSRERIATFLMSSFSLWIEEIGNSLLANVAVRRTAALTRSHPYGRTAAATGSIVIGPP